ncbi:hypothetical protein Nepgr_010880 [Nepenthes gracilis]|uniref:LOB domain-containing protein n=1 Tax=Nepenthes gracilis TaxID=150966 RepID=A0AAD3SE33_NEPGR|nr:hypothetical protein Nepgr_010880 [Nepenthes gracilis]
MNSTRCAACKYLRKKCPPDCIFSPLFPASDPQRFAHIHRIYGAGNIARMLQKLPAHLRAQAAESLSFEARCRIEDPVYGCVKIISQLQQEIFMAQSQLAKTLAQFQVFCNSLSIADPQFQHAAEASSSFIDQGPRSNHL